VVDIATKNLSTLQQRKSNCRQRGPVSDKMKRSLGLVVTRGKLADMTADSNPEIARLTGVDVTRSRTRREISDHAVIGSSTLVASSARMRRNPYLVSDPLRRDNLVTAVLSTFGPD